VIDYLLVGHITADMTPKGRTLGGTAAFAARTARAFALEVGLLTSSTDPEPLLDDLRQEITCHSLPADHTTTYENIYTPAGRVQYCRAVAAPLTRANLPDAWRRAPIVHIAPIANEIAPDMASAFDGSRLLVTPQGWMRRRDDEDRVRFKPWDDLETLRRADLVVISEEDIAAAPDLEATYAATTRRLVVTHGETGGRYYLDGERFAYAAAEVKPVDPTGAGDIFAASMIAAWHLRDDIHAAVGIAARLAALSTTRPGISGVPTPDEVRAVLA
jgi:sugar/nucleoside kinase (ribokinase family)